MFSNAVFFIIAINFRSVLAHYFMAGDDVYLSPCTNIITFTNKDDYGVNLIPLQWTNLS